jgi:hypothetical protein
MLQACNIGVSGRSKLWEPEKGNQSLVRFMTNSIVRRNPASMAQSPSQPGASSNNALAAVQASREVAEVQAAMIIARQFPRDHMYATEKIVNACMRPALAEKALYTYSRGGQEVSGPSIRLAETMAQYWGNIQFGVRELEQSDGVSTVEAFAWDIETNVREVKIFHVAHERHTKKGVTKLTDPRDIYELVANQGSRRLRSCILGIIPGDVQESAIEQCEQTLKASADTSPKAQEALLAKFAEFGIQKPQIEKRIQRRIDSIQPAQVVDLRKIYCSLRDGMSNPSDWFETAQSLASAATATSTAQPPVAPAVAAAAAPVAGLTRQQAQVITTAAQRLLSPAGVAAFTAEMLNAFGVEDFGQIPADRQKLIMTCLNNAASRAQWDQGNSQAGDQILSEEEIVELQGKPEPDAAPETEPAAEASTAEEAEDDGVGQMELA